MSRTELWEAPKDSPVEGHVAFTVDDDETVRLPYVLVTQMLRDAGLRRKINTDHGVRYSLRAREAPAAPRSSQPLHAPQPPAGYRWLTSRECHGSDQPCPRCSPDSPERRVGKV